MDMGQVFSTWWHWWRKELEELLPSSMRRWLQRTNRLMILRIQGNTLQLAMALEPGHIIREIPLGDSSDAHAVQQDIPHLDLDATTVALQLPAGLVLKRAVTLPASARNNLGTILGYQMASLTPWSQDQVHFGWHVIASSGPLLHLTLYVCPRSRVEPILQPLRRLGLEVHDLLSEEGLLIRGFFAPHVPASWRQRLRSPLPWLGALTILLLALILWLPLHFMSQELALLEAQTQQVRTAALQTSATRQQLEQIKTETAFLAKRRSRQPPAFMVIEDLADHLPLDAWVYMMRQSGSEVAIWGMAASAKEVLAAMKKSRYWQHAAFEAPAVEDNTRGTERFQLRAVLSSPGTTTAPSSPDNDGVSNDALDDDEDMEP